MLSMANVYKRWVICFITHYLVFSHYFFQFRASALRNAIDLAYKIVFPDGSFFKHLHWSKVVKLFLPFFRRLCGHSLTNEAVSCYATIIVEHKRYSGVMHYKGSLTVSCRKDRHDVVGRGGVVKRIFV